MSEFEFLLYPAIAGITIALLAGPLGVFMIWRRIAFVGDTIAHSSLLGVSLALWWNWNPFAGVFLVAILIALLASQDDQGKVLGSDTILGLISHATLAGGIIVSTSLVPFRVDLLGYLYGDILSISPNELTLMVVVGVLLLSLLIYLWRQFLAVSLHRQLAAVAGINVKVINIMYLLSVAVAIGIGMRLVGILLITALLIVPAASGRFFSYSPEDMAIRASILGVVAVVAGLIASLLLDWPSGPTIVFVSILIWFICYILHSITQRRSSVEA